MDLDGSLNSSATFAQENTSTFTLDGNWNNSGVYIADDGLVYFSGTTSQTVTNSTGSNFYDLFVSKNSGTVYLTNSNSITIDGSLNFESVDDGVIYARDNSLVSVSNANVNRSGEGFVDGPLALFLNSGNQANTTFTVGNSEAYTPVEIDLNGTGGSNGYLQVVSNDRVVNLIGSQLDSALNVERQYELSTPNGSGFSLGSRSYNMVIHYLNPEDIRNGANSNTFETARYDEPLWAPFLMETGTRTNSSVQSLNNTDLGTYVVGPEDFFLTIWSRESGSFNEPANWSLYEYGGPQSSFAPRNRDIVFIGDGDQIDLYNDISILANRTLTVELAGSTTTSGTFMMDENTLSGGGTFTLENGGWLGFGDPAGLTLNDPLGNIQTQDRNYNIGNHNNASFVFTGSNSSTVGDGFPADLDNFYVQGSDELFLLQNTNVNGDLSIDSGILDIQSFEITGTNSGSFSVVDDARLRIGSTNNLQSSLNGFDNYFVDENSYIVFNGTDQTVSLFPTNFDTVSGYGNLIARGTGTKLVNSNMQIRGNLYIQESAYFENAANVTNLLILQNVINENSGMINYGRILLGN